MRAGDGIGDHQRRRGEVVHAHFGVDAALEIAVAGQHRADRQIAFGDGLDTGSGNGPELPMQVVQP